MVEDKTKQYCSHEHCEGREKEVVCIHNYEKLDKLEKRKEFFVDSQTGHGASGSPVVNDNSEVIALHSWGMFLGNEQQREKPALEFAHSINCIVKDININKKNEALARKLNFYGMKT
jgi:V8-like Glu-specific endopeptidase